MSVGQIDAGKVSSRPCECYGVFGCVLIPLDELKSSVQCVSPRYLQWPLEVKWLGVMVNALICFLTAFASLLTNVNCGEIWYDSQMHQYQWKLYLNPRTDVGGRVSASPRFSMNSGKTASHSPAKFYITIHLLIFRVVCKWWPPIAEGQVIRSLGMTRCQVIFCIFIAVPEPQLMTKLFETRWMV